MQKNSLNNKRRESFKALAFLIVFIFIMFTIMLTLTFSSFYNSSVSKIEENGRNNLERETAQIESYLNKSISVLQVSAYTVNYMMNNKSSSEEIFDYLVDETNYQMDRIDSNFTGIYGYINGEFIDGSGWIPPEGYVATERVWYTTAFEAKGKPIIVPPYLDAKTNTVMISISQLLSDGVSVISLDIALNEIQNITSDISLNGMGYGFVIDSSGLIVAHVNEAEKGTTYSLNGSKRDLLKNIYDSSQKNFVINLDGEKCTVFSNKVLDDWYVVLIVSNDKLFEELRQQIYINVLTCFVIYIIIIIFCTLAYEKMLMHKKNADDTRRKLDELNENVVKALAYTIDAKDRYTSGHSQRVANYSLEIARRMGKSEEEQQIIYYAGLLHDVGKIRVPEDVINKPGKLSEDEFNQIKMHPVSGFHILKDIYNDNRIAYGAKYHHERYDGTGYPTGLVGKNIPEFARIIGIADAYDAMASNRSYRDALPQEAVRAEIENGAGKQFDPEISKIMLQMIDEDRNYTLCQTDSMKRNILVVDDEKMNIRIVQFIFRDEEEYNVFSATNCKMALEILNKNKIDIVLLDIFMPDVDGFEMYSLIREKYSVPVVFTTADKNIETIQKATELGIDDYVAKPFLPSILKETVHGIIHSWK